jgi:hypothetical protein
VDNRCAQGAALVLLDDGLLDEVEPDDDPDDPDEPEVEFEDEFDEEEVLLEPLPELDDSAGFELDEDEDESELLELALALVFSLDSERLSVR